MLFLNILREQQRLEVSIALGVSYALTSEGLPYSFFSCQTLEEEIASNAHMVENMNKLTQQIKRAKQ